MIQKEKKYGELEIDQFDIADPTNFWEHKHPKNYLIDIKLPEFMCRCPRSGYFDFACIYLQYSPDKYVIELKALKLYINSFADRYISHEDVANEIFDTLYSNLSPKKLKTTFKFNPRGNVTTDITIDSELI